jgi:transcriptional regulator with XRE-family HTH domain
LGYTAVVTTSQAILMLREKMGCNQQQFADRLRVTLTSVSRYENGREPSNVVLKKLAELAEDAKLDHLRDVFAAKRRAGVVARIDNLPSAGTQRRVSVDELQKWHKIARQAFTALQEVASELHMKPSGQEKRILMNPVNRLFFQMHNQKVLADEIEVYIHHLKETEPGRSRKGTAQHGKKQ